MKRRKFFKRAAQVSTVVAVTPSILAKESVPNVYEEGGEVNSLYDMFKRTADETGLYDSKEHYSYEVYYLKADAKDGFVLCTQGFNEVGQAIEVPECSLGLEYDSIIVVLKREGYHTISMGNAIVGERLIPFWIEERFYE